MFYFQATDDIQLRVLELKNAKELYRLIDDNRLFLREWLPWVGSTTGVEVIKQFIKSSKKQMSENNGFQAGIYYKGEIAGCIGLHSIDWSNKKTTIGYWLASDFQGKGIMTQSCKAIVNYVIKDLGLNRVEIRAAELNSKSRAIAQRLGFIQEGICRQVEWLYDHYVDHVIYAMLSEEWKNQQ